MDIDFRWPEKTENLDKCNFNLEPFMRIWWYYKDEWEMYQKEEDEDFNPKKYPPIQES